MSDMQPDDLRAALEELFSQWAARAQDAQDKARHLISLGAARTEYYRGIAETYRAAVDDLRALLDGGQDEPEIEPERYVLVSLDTAQTVLKLAGLTAAELRAHKDGTFSLIFLPLQFRSVQEVTSKLLEVADVVILDHGRLSNTNQSFVDFAFRAPPV